VERIRVTYADHNSEIERQLPLEAALIEKVELQDSKSEWWLVAFERALLHVGTAFSHALVAPRSAGQSLAGPEPVTAILLLSASRMVPAAAAVSSFPHVAWCSVKRIGA